MRQQQLQLSYPAFTSKHAHFPFLLWFNGTLCLSKLLVNICISVAPSVLCVNEKGQPLSLHYRNIRHLEVREGVSLIQLWTRVTV